MRANERARVVVWLTEGTWASTVRAAAELPADSGDIVLLHVTDEAVGEALHGAFGGLLGRSHRTRDPGIAADRAALPAARDLLDAAAARLGRPCRQEQRIGRVEREVVQACAGAALLVVARDGEETRLGPRSLGHQTRFVVDHAPCAVLLIWPAAVPDLDSMPPPSPTP